MKKDKTPTVSSAAALEYLREKILRGTLPSLIAVSGGTCSGKTTFVKKIEGLLKEHEKSSTSVALDEYFRNIDDPELPTQSGRALFDVPGAYHGYEFKDAIRHLLNKESIEMPLYDLQTNTRSKRCIIKDTADYIIGEGIFAGRLLEDFLPEVLHIYMDVSIDVSLARRIERDTKKYHVTENQVHDMFYMKILRYWHLHQQHEKMRAHLIVDDTTERKE